MAEKRLRNAFTLSHWERGRVRVSGFAETCDPHPALRATLSQWERDTPVNLKPTAIQEGWPMVSDTRHF
jgi:hypothetical protein